MDSSSISIVASPNTSNCYNYYDVFINHRRPDVKKTFATDLYHALTKHGLRVFLDIEELLEGDKLNSQSESAIRTAAVQIAIFSPGYALSSWCLNELLYMFEMLERGSTILPVFYMSNLQIFGGRLDCMLNPREAKIRFWQYRKMEESSFWHGEYMLFPPA